MNRKILTTLAKKLQADGVGRLGTDIFVGHMPESVTHGILIRSPFIGSPFDYELPGRFDTRFNVSCRSDTYAGAEDLMKAASVSLTIADTTLTGMDITHIRPKTEPIPFPINEAALFEFLVIFDAIYVIVG